MYKSINFGAFCDAFIDYDRNDNFSYDGKKALFEYLELYEEDTGIPYELDIIALCCEFNEYKDLDDFNKQTQEDINSVDDIGEKTTVLFLENGGFITQNY